MKNNNDIISLLNFPILIKTHEHPLILCSTKRAEGWSCDECSSSFKSYQPSFYCTFCDYDLCQNCLGNLRLNDIKKYKVYLSNFRNLKSVSKTIFNWQIQFPKHIHLLSSIKKTNNFCQFCNECKKEYNDNFFSYYCSLCDYNICEECFSKNKNTLRANISKNDGILEKKENLEKERREKEIFEREKKEKAEKESKEGKKGEKKERLKIEKKELIKKIKSNYNLNGIFDYIKDKNFKLKLCIHSKDIQNILNLKIIYK